jgi:outer membrane protein
MRAAWFSRPTRLQVVGLISLSLLATSAGKPATPAGKPAKRATNSAESRRYTLDELTELALRAYPGIEAAEHALAAMKRQQFQADYAWVPRGKITGVFAPTPEIRCAASGSVVPQLDSDGNVVTVGGQPAWRDAREATQAERENWCINTDVQNLSLKFNGVFGRIELELAMPLYTFDKIGSAQRAAKAGVQAREAGVSSQRQEILLKVSKAYWGLKLAEETIYTIEEGRKHLVKARERLEHQLDTGEGDATVTDLLRLKTAEAEIDARLLEARRLARIAREGLALLCGLDPERMLVDKTVIDLVSGELAPVEHYVRRARGDRPEAKMLEAATAASKAKAALEKAKLWPDLLLVGRVGVGGATNIDDPQNSFFSDPFNFTESALALALNWNLNSVEQYGKYKEASAEAAKTAAKRTEGLLGIEVEVRKNYLELKEAQRRVRVTKKGAKAARSWLVATSQNLAAGLAEPKDLTDALVAYFQLKLRNLEAIFTVNLGWSKLSRAIGRPAREDSTPTK